MNSRPDDAGARSKSQPEEAPQETGEIPGDFLERDSAELQLSADQVAGIEARATDENTAKLEELAALLARPKA